MKWHMSATGEHALNTDSPPPLRGGGGCRGNGLGRRGKAEGWTLGMKAGEERMAKGVKKNGEMQEKGWRGEGKSGAGG